MMRAISLHQPWASLMAEGIKKIETRGRRTHVRGELAICSAMRKMTPADLEVIPLGYTEIIMDDVFGKVLGVCNLADCLPSDSIHISVSDYDRMCGDYSPGRWAWLTDNMRKLAKPVPVIGHQGFFFLPPEVEARVRAQL